MKVVNLVQGTYEWLQWRKEGVTASEAAIVLGLSKYKTAFQLWEEKVGRREPEDLSWNPHVRRGKENEDNARQTFEADHPGEFCLPICAEHKTYSFMRASFDGVLSDNSPTEFKCPSRSVWEDVLKNGEQSESYQFYEIQVQHQMYVAQAKRGYLLFWFSEKEYRIFEILPRPDFQKKLLAACKNFQRYVDQRKEPPRDPKRDVYIPTNDLEKKRWIQIAQDVVNVNAKITSLQKQQAELDQLITKAKLELTGLMKDFSLADYAGVRILKTRRLGSIDWERLVKDKLPDLPQADIESYRKEGKSTIKLSVTNREMERQSLNQDEKEAVQKLQKQISERNLFF